MSDYFEPVVSKREDNKITFGVWGREYVFDNSLLPTSITALNRELLYAPVRLVPEFESGANDWRSNDVPFSPIKIEPLPEGSGDKWLDVRLMLASCTDEKGTCRGSAVMGNAMVNTAVTAEQDGFVKIDLKLMSFWDHYGCWDGVPKLKGLYIDIPIKKECGGFMHYWPNNDKSSIVPAKNVMNSCETYETKFAFKPYLAFGNNDMGLGIFVGESAKSFELTSPDECIVITEHEEYVNVRINLLQKMPSDWEGRADRWITPLNPVCFTFGFQAYPVKKMVRSKDIYRSCQLDDCSLMEKDGQLNEELIEKLARSGVKTVIIHERWSAVQNWGEPMNEALTKAFVRRCHDNGIKVLPYFGYEFSTLHSDFAEKAESYLNKTAVGNYCGGWQRMPWQRAFMVCYKGGYGDELIERITYLMDEYGIDGVFCDGMYIPWECANENHGCGYRDDNGTLHTTYPVLALREFVKKLYDAVHSRGGIIDAHQSTCCVLPVLSFCDMYYDGENIQDMLHKDDMSFLNYASFRAEYMGCNFGIPTNFIAYATPDRPIEILSALTLPHNVHCRPSNFTLENSSSLDYVSKIWKIFERCGLDEAEWIPYWKNTEFTSPDENAIVSVYKKRHGAVLAAADLTAGKDCINFELPKKYKTALDLISGDIFKIESGRLKARVAPCNPLLLSLKE